MTKNKFKAQIFHILSSSKRISTAFESRWIWPTARTSSFAPPARPSKTWTWPCGIRTTTWRASPWKCWKNAIPLNPFRCNVNCGENVQQNVVALQWLKEKHLESCPTKRSLHIFVGLMFASSDFDAWTQNHELRWATSQSWQCSWDSAGSLYSPTAWPKKRTVEWCVGDNGFVYFHGYTSTGLIGTVWYLFYQVLL